MPNPTPRRTPAARLAPYSAALLLTLCFASAFALPVAAQDAAQTPQNAAAQSASPRADVNFEVRLHLLDASSGSAASNGAGNRLPSELQTVVNQLRRSLPFTNYALGMTFINRVHNRSKLEFKAVTNSLFTDLPNSTPAPQFYEFSFDEIRLESDGQGGEAIAVLNFRFGARVPVQTATTPGTNGASFPVISYEPTGLRTTITVREDTPVVVGTLATRAGGLTAVVMHVKRADAR